MKIDIDHDSTLKMGEIAKLLTEDKQTLSVAESCTAGLLGFALTSMPGSSSFFYGGIAAYSNEVKKNVLGVSETTIADHGAVSKHTCLEMARACKDLFGTTYGISLTGVAGPGGGSLDKPVGTVWCGISGERGAKSILFHLSGSRQQIRCDAAMAAIGEFVRFLVCCREK